MNTPMRQFALLAFTALAFIGSAQAQRGGRDGGSRGYSGGGERRSGGYSQSQSTSRQSSSSFDRQSRRETFGNQTASVMPRQQNTVYGNRDVVSRSSFDRRLDQPIVRNSYDQQRVSRSVTVYNNNRYVSSYAYPVSHYSYIPRRYVYVGAPHYSALPYGALTIRYGGYPYYYHSGLFFSYYNGYYAPVFAPIGIHVSILPTGYYPFY